MRNKAQDRIAELAATCCYLGYLPYAPGTIGAAAGLIWWMILRRFPGFIPRSPAETGAGFLFFLAIFFLVAVWSSGRTARVTGRPDPASVIIDEAFSIFITFFAVAPGPHTPLWFFLAAGFALNRIFDIVKPFPLRQIEALPGGWGIVLDDAGAGAYSNLLLRIILLLTG